MRAKISLESPMGIEEMEKDLPFIPSLGDTLAVDSRRYAVIQLTWVLSEDPNIEDAVAITATTR